MPRPIPAKMSDVALAAGQMEARSSNHEIQELASLVKRLADLLTPADDTLHPEPIVKDGVFLETGPLQITASDANDPFVRDVADSTAKLSMEIRQYVDERYASVENAVRNLQIRVGELSGGR